MFTALKSLVVKTSRLLLVATWFAAAPVSGVEKSGPEQLEAALAEAGKWAAAGKWREALAAGEKLRQASRELRGEQHVDTAMAEMFLGQARLQLGEPTLAEEHFRRALAIQEQALSRQHPELVAPLTQLGALLKDQSRHDEAAGLLSRALEIQTQATGESGETAVCATNLARVLRRKGDLAGATALLERALTIMRRVFTGTGDETLDGLHELALVQEAAGKIEAAELAAAERVVGVESRGEPAEIAEALAEWGRLAIVRGEWAEAERRFRRALAGREQELAPALRGRLLAQLGWVEARLGRTEPAKRQLEQALALQVKHLGPHDVELAMTRRFLASVDREAGALPAARDGLEKAIEIYEELLGPNASPTLDSLGELGELLLQMRDFGAAASVLERRRFRTEESTGRTSPQTVEATRALTEAYESAGRWTEAIDSALRGLRLAEERHGPVATETLAELMILSRICEAAAVNGPALRQYERLAAWFAAHPGTEPRLRAQLSRSHAIAASRAGEKNAEELLRESARLHAASLGPEHPETLRLSLDLWGHLEARGQPARALSVAEELARRTARIFGLNSEQFAQISERLGELQLRLGDRDAARRAYRAAIDACRAARPEGVAALLHRAATRFEAVRDFARAAEWRMERLQVVRQQFPGGSDEEAAACAELGLDYLRARDLVPARGIFTHQRQILVRRSGEDSPGALAATALLADVALAAGDLPLAMAERERLVKGCAKTFGASHVEHGRALLLLGEAQLIAGREAGASHCLNAAAQILSALRPGDPLLARVAADRAVLAVRAGKLDEARGWTRDTLRAEWPGDDAMAEALVRLGDAWAVRGEEDLAEVSLAAALSILTKSGGGEHDEPTVTLLQKLARLRTKLGRPEAAETSDRALAAAQVLFGGESPEAISLLGWAALAHAGSPLAVELATERLGLLERLGAAGAGQVAEARVLRHWLAWRAGGSDFAALSRSLRERWPWLALADGALDW